MDGYPSGHKGAVLKTVRAQAHRGSNPLPSVQAIVADCLFLYLQHRQFHLSVSFSYYAVTTSAQDNLTEQTCSLPVTDGAGRRRRRRG